MEEDIKEINNLSPVEWAMRELKESYELKHRDWASNCLDIIKEELDNCIPISVIQNKIDELIEKENSVADGIKGLGQILDCRTQVKVLQELLDLKE